MKPSTKSGLHLPPEAICPMYIRFRISQGVRPCNLKVFSCRREFKRRLGVGTK